MQMKVTVGRNRTRSISILRQRGHTLRSLFEWVMQRISLTYAQENKTNSLYQNHISVPLKRSLTFSKMHLILFFHKKFPSLHLLLGVVSHFDLSGFGAHMLTGPSGWPHRWRRKKIWLGNEQRGNFPFDCQMSVNSALWKNFFFISLAFENQVVQVYLLKWPVDKFLPI